MAFHSNGGAYSGDERESRSGGEERPDSDLSDKPVYLLEHLATFTVNKETGIVYPSDGMRRLLQLEKTTGIWSQKMQLCLDNHWVLIMDYETGNVIERFPASLIQDPTAFTSNSPMEIYNNILVFIVAGGSGSRSEMHIFQCQSISAVHLVEDLKQLRNGKIVTQLREATIPQSASSGGGGNSQKLSHHHRNNEYNRDNVGGFTHNETDSELGILNDETSSTSSDKYERDVTVLNHCFDDIEKFIARLQHAAAASRELERRRRNRKSKKKDPGEGLLTLRTRPPHEKEFIDIFAKFKLSLNLLAKLKAHIHDPNAPELVHFLFTPLALIVEASSDTYYESHLPAHVINPLLTRDAINLLNNCVTSKETELWRSLGDAWLIPKDQWKGHIGNYHPVFFDGFSPDYPVVDDLEHPSTPNLNTKRQHIIDSHFVTRQQNQQQQQQQQHANSPIHQVQNKNGYDFDRPTTSSNQQQQSHHHHHHHHHHNESASNVGERSGFRDYSARSDISIDSIERNGINLQQQNPNQPGSAAAIHSLVGGIQNMGTNNNNNNNNNNVIGGGSSNTGEHQNSDIELWLEKLQSRGAKVVQVTYPRTANNDKELTVVRGEFLEILDDTRKWWKARNIRGQTAHVPHTIVTSHNFDRDNNDIFNNSGYTQNFNKNRINEPETSLQQNSAEWIRNKHIVDNEIGQDINNNSGNYSRYNSVELNSPPPPPPPPPNASNKSISEAENIIVGGIIQNQKNNNNNNNHNQNNNNNVSSSSSPDVQKELKHVLTLFREKRRNLEIIKTPEIYIEQSSSPAEVQNWLKMKGFSKIVCNNLKGLNGNDLFAFKRHHLEDICGSSEGKRLASQITIQRNVSGYKTARSSELQAILAKAREKSEQTPNNFNNSSIAQN